MQNPIEMFRSKVLSSIAKCAFEGTLEQEKDLIPYTIIPIGSEIRYRCCEYRERAILFERCRIASGKRPTCNGQDTHDNEIIHVIDIACEECPINRFTVTENCQNCINKNCQSVCPAQAISFINDKAYINQQKCKECGKCKEACPFEAINDIIRPCIKSCPVKAMSMNDSKKCIIDYDKCINCGNCIVQCPFGAISEKSSIIDVIKPIRENRKVIAIIAPSLEGQFGPISLGSIKQHIIDLGFSDVYEAAEGADLVAEEETEELIEIEKKNKLNDTRDFLISSCCPANVSYIEKYFPQYKDKISHAKSPMLRMAEEIRKECPEADFVFIGPCIAKKAELQRQQDTLVDFVLTFEELKAMFQAKEITLSELDNIEANQSTSYGKNFAQSGGLTAAIRNQLEKLGKSIDFRPKVCNGIAEIKKALASAKKLDFNFLECMVCKEGCIGGPAKLVAPNISRVALNKE